MTKRLEQLTGVSLADQAKERIRTAILEGNLKPEEKITIERIAAELGISRTPVREALKALEMDGLVKLLPHRGAVVEAMALEELIHRYTVRAMLEGYAAELACRANPIRIADALEENCKLLSALAAKADNGKPEQVRPLGELNQQFHAIIREGSRSQTIIRLLESFRNPFAFTLYYWSNPARQRASIAIHKQIAAAFRRKSPKAARRLMEKHILQAREQFMKMKSEDWRKPQRLSRAGSRK